jgi:hypothetical protein
MLSGLKETTAYLFLKLVILAMLMGLAFLYMPYDLISSTGQGVVNWTNSVQTVVRDQYPVVISDISAEASELKAEISKDVQNIKEQAKSASSAKIKASFNGWIDNLFKTK